MCAGVHAVCVCVCARAHVRVNGREACMCINACMRVIAAKLTDSTTYDELLLELDDDELLLKLLDELDDDELLLLDLRMEHAVCVL